MIKYKYTKKKKNIIGFANLYVQNAIKNTIISLTKNNGEVLKQWSTKSLKKTRFKKNTPYNVQLIVYKINKYIKLKKIKRLKINLNGSALGRYNILKNLQKKYIKIDSILDRTPIPFNGCRQKKMKRR